MSMRVVCCLLLFGLLAGCTQVPVTGGGTPTGPVLSVPTATQPIASPVVTEALPVEVPTVTRTPFVTSTVVGTVTRTPYVTPTGGTVTRTPFVTPTMVTETEPSTIEPTTGTPAAPASPLTRQQAENFTYRLYYTLNAEIMLQNGVFDYQDPSDPSVRVHSILHPVDAYGHINTDNSSDAVVVLVTNTGGSGNFYDMVALANHNGTPIQVAEVHLGDRQIVNSITINDDRTITLDFVTHDDDDAFCCPTQHVRRNYIWIGADLVVQSEEVLGTVTPVPNNTPVTDGTITPVGTPFPTVTATLDSTPTLRVDFTPVPTISPTRPTSTPFVTATP